MSAERWFPHVTVAAVAARDGRFLFVEELIAGRHVLNQPAGHLEPDESLLAAVRRETLEETAWTFEPEALVGIYRWQAGDGETFLRFTFCGALLEHDPRRALDPAIASLVWLSAEELDAQAARLRSPLVSRSVRDFLSGVRYPLDALQDVGAH